MYRFALVLGASLTCALAPMASAAPIRAVAANHAVQAQSIVNPTGRPDRLEISDVARVGSARLDGRAAPLQSLAVETVTPAELLPNHTGSGPFSGTASLASAPHAAEVRLNQPSSGAGGGPFNTGGACTYNVQNHGGRILTHARIHRVFWGDYWTQAAHTAEASSYDNTWTSLANSPAFYTRLSEYGAGVGSAGVRYNVAGAATGSVSDSQITTQIQSYINNTSFQVGVDDLFVVFLPSGTTNQSDISNGWSGHHDHFTAYTRIGDLFNEPRDLAYAVIEYSTDSTYTNPVVSHECTEAITDPALNAWWDSNFGSEVGDICRFTYNNIAGTQVETIYSQDSCRCVRERDLNNLDYFGSGKPNDTIFRNGQWWFNGGSFYWNFGQAGDQPIGGDYNGDGKTEFALFRGSSANWFTLDTTSGIYDTFSFGQAGDIAVPADYDGDGKTDRAVWRPSNGTWYIVNSSTGAMSTVQWGVSGDIPVPADFDNDGKADPAVRRPSNSTWYVLPSTTPGSYTYSAWGYTTDIPVTGDFNGDGKSDWALFRPSEGRFYISPKDTNSAYWVAWGVAGDIPVVRDYDGDWKSDLAVWRPSNGTWYVTNSAGGTTTTAWGQSGDIPVERSSPQ